MLSHVFIKNALYKKREVSLINSHLCSGPEESLNAYKDVRTGSTRVTDGHLQTRRRDLRLLTYVWIIKLHVPGIYELKSLKFIDVVFLPEAEELFHF